MKVKMQDKDGVWQVRHISSKNLNKLKKKYKDRIKEVENGKMYMLLMS